MKKKLVFISHIKEEKEIAHALKLLVEKTFLGMIEVFTFSDPISLKSGRRWLDEITNALKECSVEIILASSESLKRPWINFEAGCGWIRDIPVIPLCHSGMTPGTLPSPLSALQASTATEETALKLIFPAFAEAIGCVLPENIDYTPFISVVKNYEEVSRQVRVLAAILSAVAPTDGLSTHESTALLEIAEVTPVPGDYMGVDLIAENMKEAGFRRVAFTLALSMLTRKGFTETASAQDYNGNDYSTVRITPDGWAWIEANQDKIDLKLPPELVTAPKPPPPTRPRPAPAPRPAPPAPTEPQYGEEQQFKEDDIPF